MRNVDVRVWRVRLGGIDENNSLVEKIVIVVGDNIGDVLNKFEKEGWIGIQVATLKSDEVLVDINK